MFFLKALRQQPEFWEGVREQSNVSMGIAAWGLMTGVAMVEAGLSGLEAVLMTLIVFAGSAQLAAVPMLMGGAPVWVIVAAAFCVNLRFVVFSAHLRPYMMHLPLWQRLVSGYVMVDLTYVFFTRRYPLPGVTPQERLSQQAYMMGNCAINYVAWMGASLVGIALSNAVPTAWGLSFAGILALVGVLASMASSGLRVVSVGVAGTAAVAAWALPLKLNIVVAIASAVAVCLVIEALRTPRGASGASGV